jgi:hypothetical protein
MMDWVALEMLLHFSDFLNIVHQNWIPYFTLFLDVFLDDFGICLNDKRLLAKSFIFLRDNSRSSYSVVLFVEGTSSAKSSRTVYLCTTPVGDVTIAATPTPLSHQAPSQCTIHGVTISSLEFCIGDVQSTMKSAKTCDVIVLLLSKSTMYFDSSTSHFTIQVDASLLVNKSFRGWFVITLILWPSK